MLYPSLTVMQDFPENTKAAGSLFYPLIQLFLPTLLPATDNVKLFLLEAENPFKQSGARTTPAYVEAGVTHLPMLQFHYRVLANPNVVLAFGHSVLHSRRLTGIPA